MATVQFLSVYGFSPRLGWDQRVSTRPQISLRVNQALDTSLVDTDAALSKHVILVRVDTDETVGVEYVSWDAVNKLLTFQPEDELAAGAVYQVTVRETLRGSSGRGLVQPVSWAFQVGVGQLSTPVLSSPADASAWTDLPTLQWIGASGSAATGLISYDVHLGEDWRFAELLWTTTVAVSGSGGTPSATIGSTLTGNATYFWRVRARTASVTGDWSASRAFWVGVVGQVSPETEQLYQPELAFSLDEWEPEDGAANLSSWPTIRLTFTQDVSGASVNFDTLQLWASPVDGRLGTAATLVGGEFTVAGNVVDFAPSGSIADNTRYTLRLRPGLLSEHGDTVPESTERYFTGTYTPCYGGTIAVRAELGDLLEDISDDQIAFHLWRSSLFIHELLYTRNHRTRQRVTLTDLVSYSPPHGITWGMLRYAELGAAVQLLQNEYSSLLRVAGRRHVLATYEHETKVELLPEIRARVKELKAERDGLAATFFSQATLPRTGVKAQFWDPCSTAAVDHSFPRRRQF